MRRLSLVAVAALALVGAAQVAAAQRPNIGFIVFDYAGFSDCGA